MIGTKHISDLITDPKSLQPHKINIIDADVSAGKTWFALTTLPKWTKPSKILYLIDTSNGEYRILRNILTVSRQTYSLYDYGNACPWGERSFEAENNMPVMTYAGFGSEVRNSASDKWIYQFDYIVCDEMQNLVDYQRFSERSTNLEAAEHALRKILAEGSTTIVAMSATPQKIRDRFEWLCCDVPFDRTDLRQLETSSIIPYIRKVKDLLSDKKGKTGILYTAKIEDMKRYIDFGNSIGIRTSGFWSISAET